MKCTHNQRNRFQLLRKNLNLEGTLITKDEKGNIQRCNAVIYVFLPFAGYGPNQGKGYPWKET